MSEPTPRRHRRWFSLSLRGMMLLILVVGGFMGWKARRASLQRRAVARIERLQGDVVYDWQARDPYTPAVTFEPPGPVWLRKMLGDEYFQEVVTVVIPGSKSGPPTLSPDEPKDSPRRKEFYEFVRRYQKAEEARAQDELACLEGLDRIETLGFYDPPLKSAGLARLGRLTSLKELSISWPLSDEGLAQVAKLSSLERLTANFKLEDDSSLALLERLPRLKALSWFRGDMSIVVDKITDTSMARLGRLQHLTLLDLDGSELTDTGLAHLKGMAQLEELWLEYPKGITDVGLAHLKEITSLKTLSLEGAGRIGDEGLAHLKGLKKLESLNLDSASGVTDAGLGHLVELRNLYWLNLESASSITDPGVEQLVKMPQLVFLGLNVKSVTDTGLNRLKSLTNLSSLLLTGRKINGEILDEIQAAIPRASILAKRIDAESAPEAGQPSSPPVTPYPANPVTPPPAAVPRN